MREVTHAEAESIAGFRVDRRRRYAVEDDGSACDVSGALIFSLARWTESCSGCNSDDPYKSHLDGTGCEECGYTGRRRYVYWVPYLQSDAPKGGRGGAH